MGTAPPPLICTHSTWGLKNRQPFFWPHDPSKWLQFLADPHQLCVWGFFPSELQVFFLKNALPEGRTTTPLYFGAPWHPEDHPAWLQDRGVAGRSCLSAQGAPPAPLPHVTPHKWLGKLKPGRGKGDCSRKAYEMESQQTLGQLKLRRWKCDTSPHGAGCFPAESAKSLELAHKPSHQHVQNQTRK